MDEDGELTIALIDDDARLRRAVVKLFASMSSRMRVAAFSALDDVPAGLSPDCLLLDLSLEDSAGVMTIELARQRWPWTPIVVLTGHADQVLELQAIEAGAAEYLTKPDAVTRQGFHMLEAAIDRALARKGVEPMSPIEKVETAQRSRDGIFLPTSVFVTLLLALAGIVATYIFATKGELGEERTRISLVEQRAAHNAAAIVEIKHSAQATEANLRTLLIRSGVPASQIETAETIEQKER